MDLAPLTTSVSSEMDRHNSRVFLYSQLLIFLAAPVVYVGVVQAALCDKLGANATIANLPASTFLIGSVAPLFLSWWVPYRWERAVLVTANTVSSVLLTLVFGTLVLPFPDSFRIAAVVCQGLILGFSSSTALVFMYQCLGRGTSLEGRARALKSALTLGPIAAVLGSLGAQFVLNHGVSVLIYPYDFALLYFIGIPCTASVALVTRRYQLIPLEDKPRQPFLQFMAEIYRSLTSDRTLLFLWIAYLFWYCTLASISNLSLYTREALNRDPKDLSGMVMALRFGFKSAGGFLLGAIAIRWGIRAPLVVTVLLVGFALLWAWTIPGYAFLLAFGLMGAGELGGAYFPNYVVSVSPPQSGARNLALLTLATPFAGFAPVLHGRLTDAYGFPASFLFGIVTALMALALVLKLPAPKKR